jgi:hypothetical protein
MSFLKINTPNINMMNKIFINFLLNLFMLTTVPHTLVQKDR